MNNERTKMRSLDNKERINNFLEVNLGFNDSEAIKEANRCLNCANPLCMGACPVNINIPAFIEKIKNGHIDLAYKIISTANYLPSICGRVCPQESQCEGKCVRGFKGEAIAIGALERYVSDYAKKNNLDNDLIFKKNNYKVAIVGSGPSGLSCAGYLINHGYNVDVYESLHELGGVLTYGIPEFRLPNKIILDELNKLKEKGVNFYKNVLVGKTILLQELIDNNDAVFIGVGAGLPKLLNIKNENINGVLTANELLTRVNLMSDKTPLIKPKNAIVIGGGNVACDAARVLRRLGSNVTVCYRRDEANLKMRKEEYIHAIEEGVLFKFNISPKEILGNDNYVSGILFNKTEVIDNHIVELNETIEFECDMIISAIGTNVATIYNNENIINVDNKKLIIVEDGKTNIDSVYAGGDIVTGSATVIKAMEAGKNAAIEIDKKLGGNENE